MDTNLLSHIAWWLGVPSKLLEPHWPYIEQSSLNLDDLRIKKPVFTDRFLRKLAFLIMERTHPANKASLRSLLKSARRFIKRKHPILPDMAPVKTTSWHLTLANLKKLLEKDSTLPSLKTRLGPAICITHDIDTIDCYESVPALADLEQRYGIPSVFNFLTAWDYIYNPELAKKLHADGFEIGLHGLTHDFALGYRTPKSIRNHIEKALEQLSVPVIGYRAPAFAVSENLIKILDDLGFKYDSSVHMWHPMYPSLGLSFPYQYPSTRLIEFPLSIEDAMLFGDFSLDENQAIEYIKNTLDAVIEIGGIFILNIHPSRIKTQLGLVETVLKFINEKSNKVLVTTPKVIIEKFADEIFSA